MARSGYAYRGYSTYSGVPPSSDEWSKTSYASDTDQYLCQPVFADAEERKLAIILANPYYSAQGYVTKVEAVIEYHGPSAIIPKVGNDYGYKHCFPPMDEPVKDYGYKVDPWKDYGYKNSFPTKAEPMKDSGYKDEPVKDYKYKTEPVKGYGYKPEPMRDYGYTSEPPVKDRVYKVDPTKDYGYKTEPKGDYGYKAEPMKEYGKVEPMNDYKYPNDKWHRPSSPIHDRQQKVEDYTENGRSRRFQDGRQYNNYSLNASTNIPMEPSSDRSVKPPENLPRNGNAMEPTMINTGGWVRPNRATLSTPPPSHHDATLSKSTSDPGTAVENSKEALKPLSVSNPIPRFSVPPMSKTVPKKDAYTETINSREAAPWPPPSHHDATLSKSTSDLGTAVDNSKQAVKPLSVSGPTPRFSVPPMSKTVPKKDAYTETIDSREAARRYVNVTYLPPATELITEDNYTKTIDSREAVRKYGGAIIG